MPNPRFSIVIPTRQRHCTLASAIESVLFQPYQDFELIVQDNCSSEDTFQTVRRFGCSKIKYNRSPQILPMNENWELALDLCAGDYVFYMGDDDAVLPDGLTIGEQILQRQAMDILMWEKYTYWWEDAVEATLAGRLFLHTGLRFAMVDPHALLQGYYDWTVGFGGLPSVYTGFVKRALIEEARSRIGKYFYVGAPDNFTGIINAYLAKTIGYFERGLSLCGNSGQSTGCSYFFRSLGERRRRAYHQEEGKSIAEINHPALIPSVNLEIGQADMMLRAKELMFPNDDRFRVDMYKTLVAMAANINRDPESYEETLAELRQMASKCGIDTGTIAVPPRAPAGRPLLQGLISPGGDRQSLAINCAMAGIHDVAGAAKLACGCLPTVSIN